jgi:type III pantothenate kinase
MLLTIDVGNTNIVYGLFDHEQLVHQFRVETGRGRTADEYAVVLTQLLSMHGIPASKVHAAVIASVVPSLTEPMSALALRAFGKEALIVGPGIRTGMSILYENPREVGADRIVNAVAAYEKVKGGVIVVDFGTATTFDCVTPKGEYMGGVIAPGIQISADALFARAAKLPRVEIAKPPKVVGRNTVHSMQSGIVFGYVGLVDGLVERLKEELGYPCAVIATGGLARLITPLSRTIQEADDVLTLVGLRILYERNAPALPAA